MELEKLNIVRVEHEKMKAKYVAKVSDFDVMVVELKRMRESELIM